MTKTNEKIYKFSTEPTIISMTKDQKISLTLSILICVGFTSLIMFKAKPISLALILLMSILNLMILIGVVINFKTYAFNGEGLTIRGLITTKKFLWGDLEWFLSKKTKENVRTFLHFKFKNSNEIIFHKTQMNSNTQVFRFIEEKIQELEDNTVLKLKSKEVGLKKNKNRVLVFKVWMAFLTLALFFFFGRGLYQWIQYKDWKDQVVKVSDLSLDKNEDGFCSIYYSYKNQTYHHKTTNGAGLTSNDNIYVKIDEPQTVYLTSDLTRKLQKVIASFSMSALISLFIFLFFLVFKVEKTNGQFSE